jgi:hypothetical protein
VGGVVEGLLDGLAVGVAIDHDPRAAGPAQQLVDGQAGELALDVPQRGVDRGDRRHGHRPPTPVGALVQVLPDVLDLVGVAADQAGDDVVGQIGLDRQLAAVQRGVADAVHAFVGDDLQGDEVAPRTRDDGLGGDDLGHEAL